MALTTNNRAEHFRTLLVLGRTSNVPTVWSNCLAGWLLGGGGELWRFILLCFGATFLYIGGMYLNDLFDVHFDRQHRLERPIPSGKITVEEVIAWTGLWFALGVLCLIFLGKTTAVLTSLLLISIILYDAVHKLIGFSPVLMASCRFFLYLVAASAAADGVTGLAVWSAVVLGAYIVGLSYLAKKESTKGMLRFWPCLFLVLPMVLAFIVDGFGFRAVSVLYSCLLLGWIGWCLQFTFGAAHRNIGRTVSGLLAGIVLVDLLAVVVVTPALVATFLCFFAGSLLFQRYIPAT